MKYFYCTELTNAIRMEEVFYCPFIDYYNPAPNFISKKDEEPISFLFQS
jgi:hypothetical protein